MVQMRLEVVVGQSLELGNEFLALTVRHMTGEQETIDQQAKLGIRKLVVYPEVGPDNIAFTGFLGIFNGESHIDEFLDVAADSLTLYLKIVPGSKLINYILLIKRVIGIRVFAEDIEYQHREHLLGRDHTSFLPSVFISHILHLKCLYGTYMVHRNS